MSFGALPVEACHGRSPQDINGLGPASTLFGAKHLAEKVEKIWRKHAEQILVFSFRL